jgi:hypothetical protein
VKHLDVHDYAALAVGHLQGGIADFSGLLAEYGAQQALLGGEVGLALGRDLAHKDVAGADLRADADDAALVQESFSASSPTPGMSRVISSGPSLVSRASHLIFFYVDGGENVLHDKALGNKDGVLVVVALPGHEANEDVLAQGDLALAVAGPSARTSPSLTRSPRATMGAG